MKAAQFDFVSFDDDELITENALIKDLSPEHLKVIFSEHQMGHYLPLTTLTYALTYKFFGEAPTPFHIFSILLHLICSWLVFLFIKLLTKSQYIALGVSVVFALHPMNTESVAWISSRSNLMFSLFYLASMIQYLRYNQSSDLNKILSVYLFFGLGLLCKSAMLTLPLTLLLIDWYQEGKITRKQIIGKIPLCIASFVFGILAIHFAGKFGTLNNPENFSSVERFCIGFRALIMQIEKFVLPINQSAIHFNPRSESIPTIVYLSPVIFLGIASIAFLKRNKTVIFGLIFFLIQMILVSQFIGIGNTITAERYAYLSHIGISLVLFTIILRFVKSQILRTSVLIMIVAILGILSFNRMDVWKNSESLYSNVISVYPDYGYGYYGLALAKQQQSLFKESLSLLDLAIEKESYFPNAINNRGNI
ncbi:MAG: glycosyltransferase family 39 protein, partial [Flavobacteriales bacterium]|nr:glycosyltransferase family 39 protein [Flavobacteriales bacterium]